MKKLLTILIIAIVSLPAKAQSSKAVKYIKKYDVLEIVRELPKDNPALFWSTVQMNNRRVGEIKDAINSDNKTALQAADLVVNSGAAMQNYDYIVEGYEELADRIAHDLGFEDGHRRLPMKIIQDNSVNASMDGIGQMRIHLGALKEFTYEELLAVCAHEAAHYACFHVMDMAWKGERKRKRNRFWAELETGLLVGAAAATSAYGISNGIDMSAANNIIANADYFLETSYADADNATVRFTFRYSRDEELEADIIAYRFMEHMGYGTEHWISAIKKMMAKGGHTKATKYDDHPLPVFRWEVLETMKDGFSGKETSKKRKTYQADDDMYK